MNKLILTLTVSALGVTGASAQYQSGVVTYPNQPMSGVVQTGAYGTPTAMPGQTVVNGGVVTQQPYLTPTTYAPQPTSYSQPTTSYVQQPTMTYAQPTMATYGAPAYTTPLSTGYYPGMTYPTTSYSSYANSMNSPTTTYPAGNGYGVANRGGFFNGGYTNGGLVGTTTNFAGQVVRAPFTVVRRVGGVFR